jgi:hypothetical protein
MQEHERELARHDGVEAVQPHALVERAVADTLLPGEVEQIGGEGRRDGGLVALAPRRHQQG